MLGTEMEISVKDKMYDSHQCDLEYSLLQIYKNCESAKCPIYFFDGIIKTFKEEVLQHQFDITSTRLPSRKCFVAKTMSTFKTAIPETISVPLELPQHNVSQSQILTSQSTIDVVCYSFLDSLKCLLNDKTIFGDIINLLV